MRESSLMEMLIKMYQDFNNHFNVPCHRRCSPTLLKLKQRKNQRQNSLEVQRERSEACSTSDTRGYSI